MELQQKKVKSSVTGEGIDELPGQYVGQYEIKTTILGSGSFATVKTAVDHKTGELVAVKIMDKCELELMDLGQFVQNESDIARKLKNHPHICNFLDVFELGDFTCIFMELIPNSKTLKDYIEDHIRLSEDETRRIFTQLISAVDYYHHKNIAHRDLKPENILLDANNNAKVIDFGVGTEFHENQKFNTFCGSFPSIAPEIIAGNEYEAPPVDMWSCGVILYTMITGDSPFLCSTEIETADFPIPKNISSDCLDLLKKLLTADPNKRATIEQVKAHPWLMNDNIAPLTRVWESKVNQRKEDLDIEPLSKNDRLYLSVSQPINDKDVLQQMERLGFDEYEYLLK